MRASGAKSPDVTLKRVSSFLQMVIMSSIVHEGKGTYHGFVATAGMMTFASMGFVGIAVTRG
jgi:hypothetical protein